MKEVVTWRTLLREIIRSTHDRQLIAQSLGVNPVTLVRWANNTSNPRLETLRALPDVLPTVKPEIVPLIEREYPDLFLSDKGDEPKLVPSAFYTRFFHDYTTLLPHIRETSLCLLVMQQLLAQLDPRELGMGVFIAQCTPPSEENRVRSLFKTTGRGTALWQSSLPYGTQFFGAESLVGDALQRAHPLSLSNSEEVARLYPQQPIEAIESMAAIPLLASESTGGCLCAFSTQPDYFTPSSLDLLQKYAGLLMIAFAPEQFYPLQDISFGVMPPLEEQRPYLATFQARVLARIKEATYQHRLLTQMQAIRLAWQELEQLFLYLPFTNS